MKRLIAAVLVAAMGFAPSAAAQTSDQQQQVAQIQVLLADVGRWSQEYQAVIGQAVQPLADIEAYVQILDRFTAGETSERSAAREIQAWRTRGLDTIRRAREAAQSLRAPPSLAVLGPDGESLDRVLRGARDNALPVIQEFERVVNACADLGLAALDDADKTYDTRLRVLLNAQMQLVRVDLGRVEMSTAAIAPEHPTHHMLMATQHYYAALLATPAHALAALDGAGDQAALVASLRQSAQAMHQSLGRASTLTEQMRARLRAQLGGPGVEIARTGLQVFETYPPSIRAYTGLAHNVERAATAIEGGQDVLEVWGEQEEWDMPYLDEIDRLDRHRAGLLANNAGSL